MFANPARRLASINLAGFDALKHGAVGVLGDARDSLERLSAELRRPSRAGLRCGLAPPLARHRGEGDRAARGPGGQRPADRRPGDRRRAAGRSRKHCRDVRGGHHAGRAANPVAGGRGGYHMEYGYSCMGYELAGAMGIKIAAPEKEVICFIGDGSYMMANSEIATAVMRRMPFTVVLTDNRGYGCINRLQIECGGAEFNNLYSPFHVEAQPEIDFVAHAAAMGAHAEKAVDIAELEAKIRGARPGHSQRHRHRYRRLSGADAGGHWWDVAVPQVGGPERLEKARARYKQSVQQPTDLRLQARAPMANFCANPSALTAKSIRSLRSRPAGATSASRSSPARGRDAPPRRPGARGRCSS